MSLPNKFAVAFSGIENAKCIFAQLVELGFEWQNGSKDWCFGVNCHEGVLYVTGNKITHSNREYYDMAEYKNYPLLTKLKVQDRPTMNTNPKEALGLKNLPMSLLSPITQLYGCVGKFNGKLKYGLANYTATPVLMSIYIDAIRRHLCAIEAGEEVDPVDKVPHWSAILANVDIILSARAAGTLIDDRPLVLGYREELEKLTPLITSLQELHKERDPHHYTLKEYQDGTNKTP